MCGEMVSRRQSSKYHCQKNNPDSCDVSIRTWVALGILGGSRNLANQSDFDF